MTYRELTIIDVREVLRCWAAGQSNRQIARDTGADRETVGRYVRAAKDAGLTPAQASMPGDESVHQVAQRVRARALPERSREWSSVAAHRERITQWLGAKRPLRLSKIHSLLVRDNGLEASSACRNRHARTGKTTPNPPPHAALRTHGRIPKPRPPRVPLELELTTNSLLPPA